MLSSRFAGRFSAAIAVFLVLLSLFTSTVPVHASANILTVDPNPSLAPVGESVTVSVVVQDFEPLNGFDISLRDDSTPGILDAVSVDFEGSIIASTGAPFFVPVNCVDDECSSGAHMVHVAAVILRLGGISESSNGPLFNIHFNITGEGDTILDIFNDLVVRGDLSLAHTTIDGSFNVQHVPLKPNFLVQTSSTFNITKTLGQNSKSQSVFLVSNGDFSGTISLDAAVSPIVPDGPTVLLTNQSADVGPGENKTVSLVVSVRNKTPEAVYVITLLATSDSLAHSAPISLVVHPVGWDGVAAKITLSPDQVQTSNRRGYLTVYIEPESPFPATAIEPSSIFLYNPSNFWLWLPSVDRWSARIGDHDRNGILDMTVRFDLAQVVALFPGTGTWAVTFSGWGGSFYQEGVFYEVVWHLHGQAEFTIG